MLLGDTLYYDKLEGGGCEQNKALLPRLSDQLAGKNSLIKPVDRGRGRQDGEDGDWVDRHA
jgi:hypothetical protein